MKAGRGLSRRWDSFDAYLFDIDGTLLNCQDAVHYFAFCDALSAVAGRPLDLDGVVTHGSTDEAILRDAFTLGGVEEAAWRPRLPEIRDRVGAQVEANREQMRIEILPGVRDVLKHLSERGAWLATATGNLARVGEVKLGQCNLRKFFQQGGWSDGCESRRQVFHRALVGVRAQLGEGATACVGGDTPADVQAAHENGVEVIAVATGIFSDAVLAEENPELCVNSLEELLGERVDDAGNISLRRS